jgi:hypothetical protein
MGDETTVKIKVVIGRSEACMQKGGKELPDRLLENDAHCHSTAECQVSTENFIFLQCTQSDQSRIYHKFWHTESTGTTRRMQDYIDEMQMACYVAAAAAAAQHYQ